MANQVLEMAKKASSRKQRTETYSCTITLSGANAGARSTALQDGKYKRSSIKIRLTPMKATIEINAADATALRASANSVLRDLQVAEASSEI